MRVIPDYMVRQLPVPLVNGKQTRPQAEYVTKVIAVKSVPAAQLVPLLRPLLPQQAHLVALPCMNSLILVDTFGNVHRIEELVQSLDRGDPYEPPKCQTWEPAAAK
jgi:general secretion pathway protein D